MPTGMPTMTAGDEDPPEDRPGPLQRGADGDRPGGLLPAEDGRRHRLALDPGDEDADPGQVTSSPYQKPAPPASRRSMSCRVVWIETTSSAKVASASGPIVPSTTAPM